MELEVSPCANQVQWVSDRAGNAVSHERRHTRDDGDYLQPRSGRLRLLEVLIVELHHFLSKEYVSWVVQTAERHISYEADLETLEEAGNTLVLIDLAGGVEDARILVEADYFEARLDNCDRVADDCLHSFSCRAGKSLFLFILQERKPAQNLLHVEKD